MEKKKKRYRHNPIPRRIMINIRLTEDERREFREMAEQRGVSMSDMVRALLQEYQQQKQG